LSWERDLGPTLPTAVAVVVEVIVSVVVVVAVVVVILVVVATAGIAQLVQRLAIGRTTEGSVFETR
jgi:hypothetical protein